jgi:hypothetical protein
MSDEPRPVRFFVGSGSLEELARLQDQREREAGSNDPDHDHRPRGRLTMPSTFKPLPPEDPIFHGGVGFVLRSELSQPEEAPETSDPDSEDDER